ncbi:MAG: ribosomal-protein-alanine N-acetyltransferase [Acidimicrobiia bacterium]|nr:ribosomal-protein-alanine N-acetyltransferase [Acidimicrobiia bacterium]
MSILGRLLRTNRRASGRPFRGNPDDDTAELLVIEPMHRSHLARVMEIERTAYPKPWTEGVFADELSMQNRGSRYYLVALLGDRLVGYGGMIYMDDAAHITNVAVDVSMRRRGIATELLLDLSWEARRAGMKSLTLEVRESNVSAQSLYRRFGFVPVGVRAKYYENRDDAIVMWCTDIQGDEFRERLQLIEAERNG